MNRCPANNNPGGQADGLHAFHRRMRFPRIQRPRFSDHRFEWLGVRYACAYCDQPCSRQQYEENQMLWMSVP